MLTLYAHSDQRSDRLRLFLHNYNWHRPHHAEMARPMPKGKGKVAGLKLENPRLMRLLEVLLRRAGGGFGAWRSAELRAALLEGFGLKPAQYTLNQLRYDLRKLAAHGILERFEHTYSYRLSERGKEGRHSLDALCPVHLRTGVRLNVRPPPRAAPCPGVPL